MTLLIIEYLYPVSSPASRISCEYDVHKQKIK